MKKLLKFSTKPSSILKGVLALAITGSSLSLLSPKANAAGVLVTAAPSAVSLSTATDVTFTYTASTAIEASATTFTFTVADQTGAALPGALANCTSADVQADTTSGGAGSFGSFTTTGAVFTTSTATTTTGRSFCIKFPSISSANIYSVAIQSSATNKDQGAALVYVGGDNQVTVTGTVAPMLSFNIRNYTDLADTNSCAIGTVTALTAPNNDTTITSPGECGYSLALATNSATGATVQIASDGKMRTTATNITDVTAGATFSAAGTEAYGLANVAAATSVSKSGVFNTNVVNQVPQAATNFVTAAGAVAYVAGTDATDTTRVIHGMAISSSTPAGSYAQLVTYTVTANF
jgi:hypothetical protein